MEIDEFEFSELLTDYLKKVDVEIKKRGLKLYQAKRVQEEAYDDAFQEFVFWVSSESISGNRYIVNFGLNKKKAIASCTCKYFNGNYNCKHIVAAAYHMIFKNLQEPEKEELEVKVPQPVNKSQKVLNEEASNNWRHFNADATYIFQIVNLKSGHIRVTNGSLGSVKLILQNVEQTEWKFQYNESKSIIFYPIVRYDKGSGFSYSCTCGDMSEICLHVKSSFEWMKQIKGHDYFLTLKDYSEEKIKLLEPYGLTLDEAESESIQFYLELGRLRMRAPDWLWRADASQEIEILKDQLEPKRNNPRLHSKLNEFIDFEIGYLFNFNSDHFQNGFEFDTVKVYQKKSGYQIKKLSLHNSQTHYLLKEVPDDIYEILVSMSDNKIKRHLAASFGDFPNYSSNPWPFISGEHQRALGNYYFSQLHKLWPFLARQKNVFQLQDGNFSSANIMPANASSRRIKLSFGLKENKKFITIYLQPILEEKPIASEDVFFYSSGVCVVNDSFHLVEKEEDLDVLRRFRHGIVKIPMANKAKVISEVIPALEKRYAVAKPSEYRMAVLQAHPAAQILLKEYNKQYLLLQPQFRYDGITLDYQLQSEDLIQQLADGSWQTVKRDREFENGFVEKLRLLHPFFGNQRQNDFLFLPFAEVMKNAWFITTVRQWQSEDIRVMGMQELTNFRYNTNPPKWEIKASSDIDWFDLRIKLSFGSQDVPLKDVRRALITRQNIVLLGDGTMGVLPEEWLQKFSMVMSMGQEGKDDNLRVSKFHFTLIDELHEQIDDEKILADINAKKQKLLGINNVKKVAVSKKIKALLRPYQLSGFQWLQVLDDMGWGGCLADDMGLGKTLQTICFLQFLKEKYKKSTSLVVCPTSLIYNWEAELQKFAPSLKYHIYYGPSREFSDEHFEDYDIVITSYGLVRNDLEHLLPFQWYYVILDESQAIKNPVAQTTRAVQLLKSKNRLILSGTPLQNNTYDLFSQFNFINPGLLGTREFYKEFANGIDKFNDAEKSSQLRRLIYPFMLRRTKEQVATDLPDKTEMILWCEMSADQRAVYEEYKNHFKAKLLEKIEEVGMAQAAMYILEGLLRLRQICDSPQLLKSPEVLTDKSVKIEELMREVEENTGQHKILIFSQFTSMLELITKRLDGHGHRYEYLDGSTTAVNRKKAVDEFQGNPAVKIFLISLKAGGVGLNLTAADYIYLVDPWWNPAVEQQAIDRTHRIGQTNKIFAYRMICKNTIEEKIIDLQKKKKQIANDLVTEDAGFIKKLQKDDIEFLLS